MGYSSPVPFVHNIVLLPFNSDGSCVLDPSLVRIPYFKDSQSSLALEDLGISQATHFEDVSADTPPVSERAAARGVCAEFAPPPQSATLGGDCRAIARPPDGAVGRRQISTCLLLHVQILPLSQKIRALFKFVCQNCRLIQRIMLLFSYHAFNFNARW